MRATVSLTHLEGYRLQSHRAHPRGALRGELLTYLRNSLKGQFMVASLRDPDNQVSQAIIELFDVRLYLIGPQGMHLRGFEALGDPKAPRFVVQGWVIVI
ncbi:MAG: hypothetical protein EB114_07365 [Betaproteobacteria bacterium]|nr:hypothetical protein [Pseudomonadota bacterium]NBO12251.1 hypothetical protein [Betaproteobacteria bacterium]NBO44830.1 hypothetical protein [Betaproteobacteria bacterium]NBP10855.1 hypothetical protein [Betaproteobacteria bacterium]NBQ81721.1 hypothetical protein [Betaproteobacteria bacterium]